jgi:hypothetical protein
LATWKMEGPQNRIWYHSDSPNAHSANNFSTKYP